MIDQRRTGAACAVAVAVVLGLAACSSSGGDKSGSSSTDLTNAVNCPTWSDTSDPLDPYSPPVTHAGTAGYTFELLDAMPPPPATGTTSWTIRISDATGAPVTNANITNVKTWMPQHGHPSTAQPQPVSNGDGTYTINNLYLYMPGVWQVTITAQAGTTTDSAMFTFCLGT